MIRRLLLTVTLVAVAATTMTTEAVAGTSQPAVRRWMPVAGAVPTEPAPGSARVASANVTYHGGPVITHPQVQEVLWGSGSYVGPITMSGFTRTILRSPYLAWMDEYRPTRGAYMKKSLGYGDVLGRRTITPSSASTTILEAAIQVELARQVAKKVLPAPTAGNNGAGETIYAVYFPAGKTVCMSRDLLGNPTTCSGQDFCAVHGSFALNGITAMYEVLPDPTSPAMHTGCGQGTSLENLQSYASHELIETITDPYTNAPAWYDDATGEEVADLCQDDGNSPAQNGIVNGYTVQREWSRFEYQRGASPCIVAKAGQPAPTNVRTHYNANRSATVSWTRPKGALLLYDVYASHVAGRLGRPIALVSPNATHWTSPVVTTPTVFTVVARNTSRVASAPVVSTVR